MRHAESRPALGLIGLGAMGGPMAANLLQAGYPLAVYDLDGGKVGACMETGATAAGSVAEVVDASAVVLASLPSSEAFACVAEGEVLPRARAGQTVIDLGTTPPPEARRLAALFAARGAALLDVPVSGGPGGVEGRRLRMFAGGERDVFERCRPILEAIGGADHITYCGPSGAGQVVKGVNQLAMGLGVAAYLEAVGFGVRAGVDAETIRHAVGDAAGEGWRRELDRVADGAARGEGERAGVKFRELPYYLREAAERGFALPLTETLYGVCDAGPRVTTDDNLPAPSYWRELMTVHREDAPDADAG